MQGIRNDAELLCSQVSKPNSEFFVIQKKISKEKLMYNFYHLLRRRFGEAGLPEHSINIKMQGSAGQSFCAFLTKGIHVALEGDANDYVGKVSFEHEFRKLLNLRHK